MDAQGWVPITLIAGFKKVSNLDVYNCFYVCVCEREKEVKLIIFLFL